MEDRLFSSRNSDLNKEQLDEIEQKTQAKNIKRATELGVKKYEKWCDKIKNSVDLKTLSPTDLSEILRKFFAEVKTEKGQVHRLEFSSSPSNLYCCTPLSRNINILQDSEFMSANKMFEAKGKLFTKENNGKSKHKSSIQSGDMQKLN